MKLTSAALLISTAQNIGVTSRFTWPVQITSASLCQTATKRHARAYPTPPSTPVARGQRSPERPSATSPRAVAARRQLRARAEPGWSVCSAARAAPPHAGGRGGGGCCQQPPHLAYPPQWLIPGPHVSSTKWAHTTALAVGRTRSGSQTRRLAGRQDKFGKIGAPRGDRAPYSVTVYLL